MEGFEGAVRFVVDQAGVVGESDEVHCVEVEGGEEYDTDDRRDCGGAENDLGGDDGVEIPAHRSWDPFAHEDQTHVVELGEPESGIDGGEGTEGGILANRPHSSDGGDQ